MNAAIIDEPQASPEEFKFSIPGHRHAYHLTILRPYFGDAFCCRFKDAWIKAAGLMRGTTAMKYFKDVRTAFKLIGYNGIARPESPEGAVLKFLRAQAGAPLEEKAWHAVTVNLSRAILSFGDNSFIKSDNPDSRNKTLESLNSGFNWLHQSGLIPDVSLEGRLETRKNASSKCLATLAFENARFSIAGLSANDAYLAFISKNVDMVEEVRRCLWEDLKDNYDKFRAGQALMSDPSVPEISQVEDALISASRTQLRKGNGCDVLGLTQDQGWILALKILKHRASGGRSLHKNIEAFARSMVSHTEAQPYFEATTKALNAAFHIILIDVGGNSQPIEDIPFKCYKGEAKKGKIVVRSLRLVKNRGSSNSNIPGPIASTTEEIELILSTKNHHDRPSGIVVIDIYKELTASMRSDSGPTRERLWVWRVAWETKVQTSLASVGMDRWSGFLEKNADNTLIGNLAITRQILRTSVGNTRGERGEIDHVIQQALMGHSSAETTFQYLSEKAVRAYLNAQIRDFLNAWEAVGVLKIEDAAARLGITSVELTKRAQFGFENGLAFASGELPDKEPAIGDAGSREPNLSAGAKSFSISENAMTCLELARRALHQQFEWMLHTNPERLLQTWVPWLALCEGYCRVILKSGFRVRFKKICTEITTKLDANEIGLPLLW